MCVCLCESVCVVSGVWGFGKEWSKCFWIEDYRPADSRIRDEELEERDGGGVKLRSGAGAGAGARARWGVVLMRSGCSAERKRRTKKRWWCRKGRRG